MRSFEALIVISLTPVLLWLVFSRRPAPSWLKLGPGVAMAFVVIHVLVEGYRWQMVPAYGLTLALFLGAAWSLHGGREQPGLRRLIRSLLGVFGMVILGITAVLAIALPVVQTPTPTGPYRTGTATRYWVDAGRDEMYTEDRDDRRALMVQFWYPADRAEDRKTTPYFGHFDVAGPVLARSLEWPPFMVDYLKLFRTHSVADAPVAAGASSYPVLMYSHGLGNNRSEALSRMEELASHGYVVVAIDHTYGSNYTVFPDGRVTYFVNLRRVDDTTERIDSVRTGRATIWADDVRFVLDQLERLHDDDPDGLFTGKLDLSRIGVLGFSNGGTTALLACQADPRLKAGIDLDGTPRGHVVEAGLGQPFMFIRRKPVEYSDDQLAAWGFTRETFYLKDLRMQAMLDVMKQDGYLVTINGMTHGDFTDQPLLSPIAHELGVGGPLGTQSIEMVNAYVLAFFDAYLKAQRSPLLEARSSPYAEVQVEAATP